MIDPSRRAKLKWQCRRGMLELDLILNHFVETKLDELSETDLLVFEKLLETSDPQLYAWLMGSDEPVDKELKDIVKLFNVQDRLK